MKDEQKHIVRSPQDYDLATRCRRAKVESSDATFNPIEVKGYVQEYQAPDNKIQAVFQRNSIANSRKEKTNRKGWCGNTG